MCKWNLLLLFFSLHVGASVKSYFNQNPSNIYTDPYRNIQRQGDDLEQVLVDQILSAKKSVYVAVQELRLPRVALALVQKHKAGVDVRVVLEHDYNFNVLYQRDPNQNSEHEASRLTELRAFIDINKNGKIETAEMEKRDAIYMLQQAKVPIIDDLSDASEGSGLMHHKFVIIDDKNTVVSTANFTMSCVHGDMLGPQTRGNANSMVVITSVAVAEIFFDEFLQLWGSGRRGNFGHSKTYRGPQTVTVRNTKITIQFSPTSRRFSWNESVNGLIAGHIREAKKSINVALFVFSDQLLSNTMQETHQRSGVRVGGLVEPKFAFREYSELLDLMGLRLLGTKCTYEPDNNPWVNSAAEAGMARLAPGDVLHHKFAVIDGKTTIMGSQNWSEAANYVNDETLIVIEDKSVSDSYTREYDRIKKSSVMGAPKWLKDEIKKREGECAERRQF